MRDTPTGYAETAVRYVLDGTSSVVTGTLNFALTLIGVLFVGAYLIVDERRIEAAYLRAAPHRYRRDARTMWDAFGYTLSRYPGGLALVLLIQGAVLAVESFHVGAPYALALGAFFSISAIIPYLGAVPALLVALTSQGLTAMLLTALLFLGVQHLEGNFLTPKIQGDTLHVHPILVFLAVIVGGGLGVIVAVPALAVLRALFDFLRVRLRTEDRIEGRPKFWRKTTKVRPSSGRRDHGAAKTERARRTACTCTGTSPGRLSLPGSGNVGFPWSSGGLLSTGGREACGDWIGFASGVLRARDRLHERG